MRHYVLVRQTIRLVLAGTVPVLRALSRRPGQSTKMSRLGIQSARIVPHMWRSEAKCRPFRTSNLLTIKFKMYKDQC